MTARQLESGILSGSPMVGGGVIAQPGSSSTNPGPAPGILLPSHPASLPSQEWTAAPLEGGVVRQAPKLTGMGVAF